MDPNLNLILQSILSSSSTSTSSSSSSVVDPYPSSMDPMFTGMSLQSLLNLNPSLLLSDYPRFSFLTDHPPLQSPLLIPKTEHPPQPQQQQQYLTTPPHSHPQPQQPFNFFFPKRPRLDHHYSSTTWQKYPSKTTTSSYSSPDTSSSSSSSPSSFRKQPPSSSSSSCVIPQSNLARQRRVKLSEKTRCLQKLMPWDKKMDQATLLEEAYKYVKFLQAQVTVLNSMPQTSSSSSSSSSSSRNNNNNNNNNDGDGGGVVFGELERLSRNQVLQVLVNSPVAQTVMSSQGLCVFSLEQYGMLRKISERRLLFQHMNDMNNMMNIASDDSKPNFFN